MLNLTTLLGDATTVVTWTSKTFHDANPTVYRALVNALEPPRWSPPTCPRRSPITSRTRRPSSPRRKSSASSTIPGSRYFSTPTGIMQYAAVRRRQEKVKRKAASWQDLFFPEIHDLAGS